MAARFGFDPSDSLDQDPTPTVEPDRIDHATTSTQFVLPTFAQRAINNITLRGTKPPSKSNTHFSLFDSISRFRFQIKCNIIPQDFIDSSTNRIDWSRVPSELVDSLKSIVHEIDEQSIDDKFQTQDEDGDQYPHIHANSGQVYLTNNLAAASVNDVCHHCDIIYVTNPNPIEIVNVELSVVAPPLSVSFFPYDTLQCATITHYNTIHTYISHSEPLLLQPSESCVMLSLRNSTGVRAPECSNMNTHFHTSDFQQHECSLDITSVPSVRKICSTCDQSALLNKRLCLMCSTPHGFQTIEEDYLLLWPRDGIG